MTREEWLRGLSAGDQVAVVHGPTLRVYTLARTTKTRVVVAYGHWYKRGSGEAPRRLYPRGMVPRIEEPTPELLERFDLVRRVRLVRLSRLSLEQLRAVAAAAGV